MSLSVFRQLILTPDFLLSPILTQTSCLSHTSDFLYHGCSRRLLNQTLAVWTPAHYPEPIRILAYRSYLLHNLYVCIHLSVPAFVRISNRPSDCLTLLAPDF
ncbi:hypothetical protein J6590_085753 [Homalodisca vitripennis]|nr:hypothetical protein J6590_085753 [Homalodisca vitripennis]